MILVSGPLGTILHTGDVRYNSSKMLKEIGLLSQIDNMILDNTFCTPKEKFPSQAEAYEILRSKIDKIHS
jgi:Cft2 family RNA processing exonuclease